MSEKIDLKAVASVTDMARMLGLSRGRFYQLIKEGIFPPPTRNQAPGRPFYNREQQARCLKVRRENRGVNGRPILFYCRRPDGRPDPPARSKRPDHAARPTTEDAFMGDLRDGLKRLGIVPACDATILAAVADCFPDGYGDVDFPTILTTVFRHLASEYQR